MGTQKGGAIAAGILGVILLALAVAYWTVPASSLPGFLPGHEANSSAHHVKHGIAALALAFFCFMMAWFQTGPKRT